MSDVQKEFEELHAGVVDWINGKLERTAQVFDSIYAGRLDENFLLVAPTGHRVNREMVTGYLEGTHGTNPEFRIQITDTRVVMESEDMVAAHCLMWHKNSKGSPEPNLGRNLSAVFARDSSMPNRLRWVFALESPLPAEEVKAKAFDF